MPLSWIPHPHKKNPFRYPPLNEPLAHLNAIRPGWAPSTNIILDDFSTLMMADFPVEKHCVLTSLTAVFRYLDQQNFGQIQKDEKTLFQIACQLGSQAHYYTAKKGVGVFQIAPLANLMWDYFGYPAHAKNKLFFFSDYDLIQYVTKQLKENTPVIISFSLGDYQNHTTTCYGYASFCREQVVKHYFLLDDHWTQGPKYVDVSKIGRFFSWFCLCLVR